MVVILSGFFEVGPPGVLLHVKDHTSKKPLKSAAISPVAVQVVVILSGFFGVGPQACQRHVEDHTSEKPLKSAATSTATQLTFQDREKIAQPCGHTLHRHRHQDKAHHSAKDVESNHAKSLPQRPSKN